MSISEILDSTSTDVRSLATTWADRGCIVSSEYSPKKLPWPMIAIGSPPSSSVSRTLAVDETVILLTPPLHHH